MWNDRVAQVKESYLVAYRAAGFGPVGRLFFRSVLAVDDGQALALVGEGVPGYVPVGVRRLADDVGVALHPVTVPQPVPAFTVHFGPEYVGDKKEVAF